MVVSPLAKKRLAAFLAEDVGSGDITGALLPAGRTDATVITKERCRVVVAGVEYAKAIFESRRCKCDIRARDGDVIPHHGTIMRITGEAREILACERTALNLLSRMSGIATRTARLVRKVPDGVHIYATRKTAPGLRTFDKEAVEIGGGRRHRMGLDESVMIKDNHISAMISLKEAEDVADALRKLIGSAKGRHGSVEAEVETIDDAVIAARAGAAVIMLDNFSPDRVRQAVGRLRKAGLRENVLIEASGGITDRNVSSYGKSGADIISAGFITDSAAGVNLSLEM